MGTATFAARLSHDCRLIQLGSAVAGRMVLGVTYRPGDRERADAPDLIRDGNRFSEKIVLKTKKLDLDRSNRIEVLV